MSALSDLTCPPPAAPLIRFGERYFSYPEELPTRGVLPFPSGGPGLYAVIAYDPGWRPLPFRPLYFGESEDIWSRATAFLRTTAGALFRPTHFFRNLSTQPAGNASLNFARLHWLAAALLLGIAAWAHFDWFVTLGGSQQFEVFARLPFLLGAWAAAFAFLVLVTRLMVRGCAGIVTDGGFRDAPEMAEMAFPIYHNRPSSPTNLTRHQAVDIDVPIGCGEAPVWPGDIMVGDGEGVVVIPAHLADEIADEAVEMTAFEDFVTEQVLAGRSIIGLYPATQEETHMDFAAWRKANGR